jgi:hypothetical protein
MMRTTMLTLGLLLVGIVVAAPGALAEDCDDVPSEGVYVGSCTDYSTSCGQYEGYTGVWVDGAFVGYQNQNCGENDNGICIGGTVWVRVNPPRAGTC